LPNFPVSFLRHGVVHRDPFANASIADSDVQQVCGAAYA